jgi:ribonuclease Z
MRHEGRGLLIDCGEGTQLAVKKAGFSLGRIDLILLTHFHADHVSGLPGLLLSMGNEGRTDPLLICGPKGVDAVVKALTVIAPELPFRIRTRALEDFDTVEQGGFSVTAFELKHSCVCLGYDVRIRRGGKFDVEKAQRNGVPQRLWSKLQRGERLEGFGPEDVLGDARRGIHVTYATDTRPLEIISTMATDADLLVCEGMFEREKAARARESSHMTMEEAARLARDAGDCRALWLTHYSPSMPYPAQYKEAVQKIFANTVISKDGQKTDLAFAEE